MQPAVTTVTISLPCSYSAAYTVIDGIGVCGVGMIQNCSFTLLWWQETPCLFPVTFECICSLYPRYHYQQKLGSTFTFHHGPCGLAQCVPEIIFKLSGHVPRPTVIAHLLLPPQYCGMHSLNTSGNYPMSLSSKAISKLTFSIVLFLYNFLLFCVLLFCRI